MMLPLYYIREEWSMILLSLGIHLNGAGFHDVTKMKSLTRIRDYTDALPVIIPRSIGDREQVGRMNGGASLWY